MLLPWETFMMQAERERRERETGERWPDELIAECHERALEYDEQLATGDEVAAFVAWHGLRELWRLVPWHFRGEVFAGVRWSGAEVPS